MIARALWFVLWTLLTVLPSQAEVITRSGSIGAASSIVVGTTTITGGTDTRVLFDDGGVIGESAGLTYSKTTGLLTSTLHTITGAGAVSTAVELFNGAVFTGGTGTTTFPQIFVQPTGTTAVTTWSTSGTIIGANVVSGFVGNFLDFHVVGAVSVFNVTSAGAMNVGGTILPIVDNSISLGSGSFRWRNIFASNTIQVNGAILTNPTSVTLQLGLADATTAVAQTFRVQSVVAGNANTAGANWTIVGSLSNGSGGSAGNGGDILFQTTASVAASGSQNAAITALRILSGTQEVRLPVIASDAALTDTTVCQDTTNHGLRSGSGALGICLGTSGRQFKTTFVPMLAGIDEIMRLKLWNYRYKPGYGDNGARMQYGPTAQDIEAVLPDLAGHNENGETINYDWGALIPITLRAIQQLKGENDNIRTELRLLRTGTR